MFEEPENSAWGEWWAPRGRTKTPPPGHKRMIPLEGDASVEGMTDSTARFVVDSNGMAVQLLAAEPLGHPRISLHQNHYAASASPSTPLGSIDYHYRDDLAATMSAYVDQAWSANSHPTGLAFRTTEPGSITPRYPAMTIRADGRVAVGGGPAALGSSLVSMGIYRKGIFELPSVERYDDLVGGMTSRSNVGQPTTPEPFVNGAIVYVKDIDKVLISQGGNWNAIVTTPVTRQNSWREMGAPRADGRPAVFGPRAPVL
jgi:hypothetical protein